MSRRKDETVGPTEGLSAGPAPRLEPVWVETADGPSQGAKALLSSGMIVVGSSRSGCDLVIRDPSISRKHASVELLPGAVRVKDLGSKNGTFYLRARVQEAHVPLGGSIRLGKTTLRFVASREEAQISARTELCGLSGQSTPMRRLFAQIEKLGPLDTSVLIRGETGTGKELVARALHELSPRAKKPFVTIDCGAVSRELIESELFGHVRGAFTGADRDHPGALDRAKEGTVLLNEIGQLPLDLQPKLLRVLESGEYRPLGSGETKRTSLRWLAVSQEDLAAHSKAGRFRTDLYFRLAGTVVEVPPLRERLEDIPVLAREFARSTSGVDFELGSATIAALQCDLWPGNVRELRNAVERVVALGEAPEDLPAASEPLDYKEARARLLEKFEYDFLVAVLKKSKGNIAAAARMAKLSRMQLYNLLKRHNLRAEGDEGQGR